MTFLMKGSENTTVPTQVESAGVIKSATSHYKHSPLWSYSNESWENIND